MGKALSDAKVAWYASVAEQFTPPEEFAMYQFGEAPSWYHYGKDRDEDAAGEDEKATPEWGAHGQLALSNTGTAEIQLPPPPPEKASLPQVVKITADVTDINQQTISASSEFTVPGADFGYRRAAARQPLAEEAAIGTGDDVDRFEPLPGETGRGGFQGEDGLRLDEDEVVLRAERCLQPVGERGVAVGGERRWVQQRIEIGH